MSGEVAPKWTEILGVWVQLGSAVIALCALGAAIIAAVVSLRNYRVQQDQLRRLTEAETRRQANGVCAWITRGLQVYVNNSSEQPVYDVVVTFSGFSDGGPRVWRNLVFAPGLGEIKDLSDTILRDSRLPADDPRAGEDRDRAQRARWQELSQRGVVIDFRDAAGQTWRRTTAGALVPEPGG